MTTSDAAFLAEVEEFLTSADLPSIDSADSGAAQCHPKVSRRRKKTPSTAAKMEQEKAKTRARRKAYVERQKLEREALKCQVQELTAELEREKTRAIHAPTISAWKTFAVLQQQVRKNVETQQRRLCTKIVARAALIREFREFGHERLVSESEEMNRPKRIQLEPCDAEIYKVYVETLDGHYAQTDDVLQGCELNSTDKDSSDSKQTWTRNTESRHFQFTDKHVVPFEFQGTCQSRWLVAHMLHRQEDRELYHKLDESERTVAIKFRITSRLESDKLASVLQRIAIRRYEQDERMVIVWRAFMQGEGLFTGMHAEETGWGVATAFAGASKASTMLRTCIRSVPMHFSTVATHEPVAKQFTGVVLESGTVNNVEITNALENLLLKDE